MCGFLNGGCSFGSSLLIKADCSNSLLPHWLHLHGNALASSSTWASFHLQHLRSSKPLAGSVDNQDWVQLNRLYSEPSRRALARHPELNRTVKPPAYGPQVPSCCCSVCLVARIHHTSHCSAAAGCCCEPSRPAHPGSSRVCLHALDRDVYLGVRLLMGDAASAHLS